MKEEIQKLVEEIKAQDIETICFWLPAYNVGGGTYYLCELAKYLIKNTDLNIYYMDYPDGYPSNLLSETTEVKILHYDEKNLNFPIKEKCAIITNSTRVIQIPKMRSDNKLLFWHYETIPCAWDIVLIDNETKKYFKLAKKNKAMVYHDCSARNSLSKYKNFVFSNKDYLPLYTTPKKISARKSTITKHEINLCFLSRLAPDKKESLYYLIENYAKYKTDKKKILHVIGDGRSKDEVLNFCKKYENEIEFIFTGTIQHEDLDEYLVNNVDIVFGVGTCVLEGCALKLPSVAMIMSANKLQEEDAYWAYNTREYSMGILDVQKKNFKIKYSKIKEIVDAVYNVKNGKTLEGEKCYRYFIDNHSNYDDIACKFLTFIKNTTLTYKKLKKCIRYTPYNHLKITLFSILGLRFIKKVDVGSRSYFYFLGIKYLKKRKLGGISKYYLFNIKIAELIEKNPYKFPTAQFKDRKKD